MSVPTVQTDNGNQQVFRPVPTHDDMRELSEQVRAAKGGQARLLVMAIFLAGIIAAGSVALIMMYGNANQAVAAAEADLAAEMKKVTALEAVITKKDETIAAQAETLDSYADFQSIIALQARSDALEADIDALLAQPSRANAPASLKQMPDEVEWLDDVVSALSARRDKLAAQKAAVEAWPPAPARVRPD
ncbi:hypothetical protein [Hyphomonas sp.]|jgi:hypothetical protein|uniref:hypothetical protein n=1 Tax=Hyphomonas sp. TaxID=87 RepID=UPI0025BCB0B4|nr:hypothetical protein [Hyphomonas sp.]MEE2920166.1 hypothetical protein [Pseudomonadota bacterium]